MLEKEPKQTVQHTIESLNVLIKTGYFDRNQVTIRQRADEFRYSYAVISAVYGVPSITGIKLDLRPDMTLNDLLKEEHLVADIALEYAIRGIASRYEDKLRPNRPLSRSLGESMPEYLRSVRKVKKQSLIAPLSDHLMLVQLIHPELFPDLLQ